MTSVAEVKVSIGQALDQADEIHAALAHAAEKLTEVRELLALTVEGSGHEAVVNARAAFGQALEKAAECQEAVQLGVEEIQTYTAMI
ncbi:MAG TPA: hypothetical protein VIR27_08550 [Mycobacteriales bacterium]